MNTRFFGKSIFWNMFAHMITRDLYRFKLTGYNPRMGFGGDRRDQASLGDAGHRMLSHHVRRGGGGQYEGILRSARSGVRSGCSGAWSLDCHHHQVESSVISYSTVCLSALSFTGS